MHAGPPIRKTVQVSTDQLLGPFRSKVVGKLVERGVGYHGGEWVELDPLSRELLRSSRCEGGPIAATAQAEMRNARGLANSPINLRSLVNLTSGTTAKGSCRLSTT